MSGSWNAPSFRRKSPSASVVGCSHREPGLWNRLSTAYPTTRSSEEPSSTESTRSSSVAVGRATSTRYSMRRSNLGCALASESRSATASVSRPTIWKSLVSALTFTRGTVTASGRKRAPSTYTSKPSSRVNGSPSSGSGSSSSTNGELSTSAAAGLGGRSGATDPEPTPSGGGRIGWNTHSLSTASSMDGIARPGSAGTVTGGSNSATCCAPSSSSGGPPPTSSTGASAHRRAGASCAPSSPSSPTATAVRTLHDLAMDMETHRAVRYAYLYNSDEAIERLSGPQAMHKPFARLVVSVLRHPSLPDRFRPRMLHSPRLFHVLDAMTSLVETAADSMSEDVHDTLTAFTCPLMDVEQVEFDDFVRGRSRAEGGRARTLPGMPAPAELVAELDKVHRLPARRGPIKPRKVFVMPAPGSPGELELRQARPRCELRNYVYMLGTLLYMSSVAHTESRTWTKWAQDRVAAMGRSKTMQTANNFCLMAVGERYKTNYLDQLLSKENDISEQAAEMELDRCRQVALTTVRVVKIGLGGVEDDAKWGAVANRALALYMEATMSRRDLPARSLFDAVSEALVRLILAHDDMSTTRDPRVSMFGWAWAAVSNPTWLAVLGDKDKTLGDIVTAWSTDPEHADHFSGGVPPYQGAQDVMDEMMPEYRASHACEGLGDFPAFVSQVWGPQMMVSKHWLFDMLYELAAPGMGRLIQISADSATCVLGDSGACTRQQVRAPGSGLLSGDAASSPSASGPASELEVEEI
mmetsp:Transcript_27856/g.89799  ORF Transcript_27856/g.89799 Transcript_27856/m.89799 type:complete len:753 (+) Transcript_27856:1247-3505(+)